MSEVKDHFDVLTGNIKEYINTNIQLIKLKVTDKSSAAIGGITAVLIVVFIMLLFLIFLSTAVAVLISNLLDSPSSGYFIVAGFYLLLGIVLYLNRDSWIITPLGNAMIKSMLKEEDKKEESDGTYRNN